MSPTTYALLFLWGMYLIGFCFGYTVCHFNYRRALTKLAADAIEAQRQQKIKDLSGR